MDASRSLKIIIGAATRKALIFFQCSRKVFHARKKKISNVTRPSIIFFAFDLREKLKWEALNRISDDMKYINECCMQNSTSAIDRQHSRHSR